MRNIIFDDTRDKKDSQQDPHQREGKVKVVLFCFRKSITEHVNRKVKQVFDNNSSSSPKYTGKKT